MGVILRRVRGSCAWSGIAALTGRIACSWSPIAGRRRQRVYRTEDPRARHMRDGVKRLSEEMGRPHWYQIPEAVVAAMQPYARHGINVNVDFYSGVVYHLHAIPRDLFVALSAIGRVPGWTAQILEQMDSNILIRPLAVYNSPAPRGYTPIEQR